MDYKLSFYNVIFDHRGSHYIYNTLSVALAELDERTYNCMITGQLSALSLEIFEGLREEGFIVEITADEQAEYLYFYNRLRLGGTAKVLAITYVPSFVCNLACPYCLEGQEKDPKVVGKKETERVLKFAEKKIVESMGTTEIRIEQIHANLYGGEPMLQKKALMQYCLGMKQLAEKYGCGIKFFIISNFTLLDDEILDLIEKYDMMVQVSIDGTREQHNLRRIYKNGEGSYDIIMSNLDKMKERHLEKNVVVRINVDRDSVSSARAVVDKVSKYSEDVYFGFLENFSGYNDCYTNQCIDKDNYAKLCRQYGLMDLLNEYGYSFTSEFGKLAPCAIGGENKFNIDPYLNVYTCELAVNQPELRVGIIDEDGNFIPNNNFYKMMNHSPALYPECMKCKMMPMCATGCSTKAYIRDGKHDGNIDKPYCIHTEEDLLYYLKHYVDALA